MTMAKEDALRTEVFPYGIAGVGLGKVERQVPVDEPPALPPNADLNVIGKSVPRQDGRAKVTGAIRFTADISLPGMLYSARRCRMRSCARLTSPRRRVIPACAPSCRSAVRMIRKARPFATSAHLLLPSPPFRWQRPKKRCA
jgi:xanthine dehydrogenase YagR molybdenum-binding subunit